MLNSSKIKQQGFILSTVLFFNVLIGLLALAIFEKSILESKMSSYFAEKNLSFIAAEKRLNDLENKLRQGVVPREAIIIALPTRICGVTFYRLTVKNNVGKATTTLQSTYAKVGDTSKCEPKPNVVEGRCSWLEL